MKNKKKQIWKIPGICLFLLLICLTAKAQKGNLITGNIVDEEGEPLIGANVSLKGNTAIGTITDYDGNFSLSIPSETKTIVVTYVGMATQEINIAGKKLF